MLHEDLADVDYGIIDHHAGQGVVRTPLERYQSGLVDSEAQTGHAHLHLCRSNKHPRSCSTHPSFVLEFHPTGRNVLGKCETVREQQQGERHQRLSRKKSRLQLCRALANDVAKEAAVTET